MEGKNVFKWVLWVGLAVVAAVAVFFFVRWAVKKASGSKDRKSVKDTQKEINEKGMSYDHSEYGQMANRVFEEMDGINAPIDSYSSTFDVLRKLKTDDDWKALFVAFGEREATYGVHFTTKFKGDLVKWMEDELSTGQLREAGGILSKIGVNVF
jgi:hypothetical protein